MKHKEKQSRGRWLTNCGLEDEDVSEGGEEEKEAERRKTEGIHRQQRGLSLCRELRGAEPTQTNLSRERVRERKFKREG